MNIKVRKLTDYNLMRLSMEYTSNAEIGKLSYSKKCRMYEAEHSPIRTQMFAIEMQDIPTFVSVHLVRHKIGVEHFVQSNRTDRKNVQEIADRNTPINHLMVCNAQALMTMARRRLCKCASKETQEVFKQIKKKVGEIDEVLAEFLVPMCKYRGKCPEGRNCVSTGD